MFLSKNREISKEITDLKRMIVNRANRMIASMAVLSEVVIGEVHPIHWTFTTESTSVKDVNKNNNSTYNPKRRAATNPPPAAKKGPASAGPSNQQKPAQAKTWATITKNGKVCKKESTAGAESPTTPTTKCMVAHHSTGMKNKEINLLHLRKTRSQTSPGIRREPWVRLDAPIACCYPVVLSERAKPWRWKRANERNRPTPENARPQDRK